MMKLICMSFAMLFVLATTSAQNQSVQPKTMTLSQAIETALEKNITVKQAQYSVDGAQSGVLAAYGSYLPSLSASGGWTRQQTDQPAGSRLISGQLIPLPASSTTSNNFSTNLSVGYTIFDGFNRESNFTKAVSSAVSTDEQYSRTKQQIVFMVQQSYLTVLRDEQLVKVAEENLKRDKRQLDRIVESNKVGALSMADVYRQQSVVASDEFGIINAQNAFDKAKADLLALIGLDVTEDYQINDPSISPTIDQAELVKQKNVVNNLDQLRRTAIAARPDYQSAVEAYRGADAAVTGAWSRYFPSVSAFAAYGLQNTEISNLSDSRGINWGLNVRWTLFDGFSTNQGIQSALVQKKIAELSVQQTVRNISVDVKKALLDLAAATKGFEASLKSVESATQDQKVAEERYNLGSGTLVDLLTANAGYVNAQANKVNATYDFITAQKNLEYALGNVTY